MFNFFLNLVLGPLLYQLNRKEYFMKFFIFTIMVVSSLYSHLACAELYGWYAEGPYGRTTLTCYQLTSSGDRVVSVDNQKCFDLDTQEGNFLTVYKDTRVKLCDRADSLNLYDHNSQKLTLNRVACISSNSMFYKRVVEGITGITGALSFTNDDGITVQVSCTVYTEDLVNLLPNSAANCNVLEHVGS